MCTTVFYIEYIITMSLIRVLKQGQKDNALSYVRPELLNTIMGHRTKLLAPTKCISVRVQRELVVILTCWVVVSRPSLAIQNRAIRVLAHEFVISLYRGNEFAILRVFESLKSPFTTKIAG